MSEAAQHSLLAQVDRARVLPLSKRTRDAALPIVVVLSLIVHATVLIPFLFQDKKAAAPTPTEIPVEVIQEPPPKAREAPKPSPPPKPVAKQEPPQQPPQPSKEATKKAADQARVSERLRQLLGRESRSVDPGLILPGESADGTDAVSYEQRVLSKLARSVDHGVRTTVGAATVTFRLGDAGEILSADIVQPSGDAALDTEAVAAVRRGAVPTSAARRQARLYGDVAIEGGILTLSA